jgi:hypothetical protein
MEQKCFLEQEHNLSKAKITHEHHSPHIESWQC